MTEESHLDLALSISSPGSLSFYGLSASSGVAERPRRAPAWGFAVSLSGQSDPSVPKKQSSDPATYQENSALEDDSRVSPE
jgi:hypothetical protein